MRWVNSGKGVHKNIMSKEPQWYDVQGSDTTMMTIALLPVQK